MEKTIKKAFLLGLVVSLFSWFGNFKVEAQGSRKIERLEKRLETLEQKEKARYKKEEKEILTYYKNGFKMRTRDNQFGLRWVAASCMIGVSLVNLVLLNLLLASRRMELVFAGSASSWQDCFIKRLSICSILMWMGGLTV